MQIAICEDERIYIEELRRILSDYSVQRGGCSFDISMYESGTEFLSEYNRGKYDIIFLDIMFPDSNGVNIAAQIRNFDNEVLLAFVTNAEQDMQKGYEVNAKDFVLKPIKPEHIFRLMDRLTTTVMERQNAKVCEYAIKARGGETVVLNLNDVYYLESRNHFMEIATVKKRYEYPGKISDEEAKLKRYNFVRTHRSHLVNMAYIWIRKEKSIHLTNNIEIPVGREFSRQFIEVYKSYLAGVRYV